MAYSYVTYTGDNSTKIFTIPFPYIVRSNVEVYLDGVLKTVDVDYTFLSNSSIQFVAAPGSGVAIRIARNTQKTTRLVDFQDASILTEASLDLDSNQLLYITQEGYDNNTDALKKNVSGLYDAESRRIINVADPVNAQDAVTRGFAEANKLLAEAEAAAAAASSSSAASSASSASGSAASASTSASNASTSATNAAASAATATTKASEANTSAINAASSASSASTSATNAASSASSAASSAATATTKASEASSSAANAAASASSAATSASNAASSASAAAASYDSFDDRYLGPKASAPTLDNDGNALLTGALYFDTSTGRMRVWGGSAWGDAAPSGIIGAISDGSAGSLGFRNKIINGAMGVAQRATSVSGATSDGFKTVDRWVVDKDGTINYNQSQQTFAAGAELEPGVWWYLHHVVNSASGQTWSAIAHPIEFARTFNGKTVTLSFWARADANRTLTFEAQQRFGSGGSNTVWGIGQTTFNLTSTFQKFTHTFTVPSISGKTIGAGSNLYLLFFVPHNTALTFDLTGVQLELGSVATPFEDRGLGTELALCRRYYRNIEVYDGGYGAAGTVARGVYTLSTSMRAAPTAVSLGDYGSGNIGGVTVVAAGVDEFFWSATISAAGNYSIDWGFSLSAEL